LTNPRRVGTMLALFVFMLRRLVSIGYLLAALNPALGQALSSFQEFPFQFREGLIWVQVDVPQSTRPLTFLLDSGASVNVLNLPTARKLGISIGKKLRIQGVNGAVTGYRSSGFSAQVANIPLLQNYVVVDLHKLSGVREESVDGLIGLDFFRDNIVKVDFASGKIQLLDSAASNQQIVPLKMVSGGFLLSASIDRNPCQWFRLDTGCASSLQWVKGKLQTESQFGTVPLGLVKSGMLQTYTTIETGSVCFKEVPTTLHSKVLFAGEAGLVGNGLLSRYASITIDAKSGRLLLEDSQAGMLAPISDRRK
jgi:hypothetical protein